MISEEENKAKFKEKNDLVIEAAPLLTNLEFENGKMSERESAIYNGLKSFRPEIAIYYKDGLLIKQSKIQSRSNLLGHLLREIDGGLRDIFQDLRKRDELKKTITDEFWETLFTEFKDDYQNFTYLKKVTAKDIKSGSNHIFSIASSFNLGMDSPIIKEYIKTALWLHKYAHRSDENTQSPRDPHDIFLIWEKFENVLNQLLSSYYIYDRIDSLLSRQIPTDLIIKQLPNILLKEYLKRYFWGKLLHLGWLKSLYNEGYFAGENNPMPVFDETTQEYKITYWIELSYIQNVAYQLSQNPDGDFSIILKVIDDICLHKDSNGKRVTNHYTDLVIISLISTLPIQEIKRKHFNYLNSIIKSENGSQCSNAFQKHLIDKFITTNDKKNLLRCLPIILINRKERGLFESYHSLHNRYFLYEFIDKKVEDIIRICGFDGFKVVEKVLEKVSHTLLYRIITIEDHYQNGLNLDNFSHQVVRFVREYLLKLPCDEKLIQIISNYLHKEKMTIYLRIAFFIINSRYEELSYLFWGIKFNPLKNISNNHELFELLKTHSSRFTKEQINRALEWIKHEDDYSEFNKQKYPSQSKKLWLTALLNTKDTDVILEYDKAQRLYPNEIEHPGFSRWMKSVSGNISPLDYESIQKMSLSEIIEYYSRFEERPLRHRNITDPTIDGLSDIVKQDIKKNISKYTLNIESITSASEEFQYSWIIGLWQYCYENKTYINSSDVLLLIYKIISNDNFTKYYSNDESPINQNKRFTHRVLTLLNCGLDCQGHMFSKENLPIVKKIILKIYQNDHEVESFVDGDITDEYNNSYSGELYDALIAYNLVSAFVLKAPINNRWDNNIRQILDDELSKKQENKLFYYALGKGYYSLFWIDKSWIELVLPIEDNENWCGFMIGFHITNDTVTQVFEYFCDSGQYKRYFANRNMFDSEIQNRVIQYMCAAYNSEKINFMLDSSLLISIVKDKNTSDYKNIIQFFNINNEHIHVEKIKDLWRFMFSINKNLDCDGAKYFIGESYRWLVFFDEIDDEIKEWMLLSVQNLQPSAASEVIRSLNKFSNKNPLKVAKLLHKLISSESKIPIYSELEKIVEGLFESGHGESAKHIANECLRKDYLGLIEIVRKYNQSYKS